MPDLEVIAEGTTGGAATIVLGSISQDYQHLSLDLKTSSTDTGGNSRELWVQINGETGYVYGYSSIFIKAGGATDANAQRFAGSNMALLGWYTNEYQDAERRSVVKMFFGNYSQTDMKHIFLSSIIGASYVSDSNDVWSQAVGGWNSTDAITSITLRDESGGNFDSHTRYCLYGWKVS